MQKIVWLTGLSGAGKSTLSESVKKLLEKDNYKVQIIDGDTVRENYPEKLGFTKADITKNNYHIVDLCLREDMQNLDFILVPVIAPIRQVREEIKSLLKDKYIEVYVKASLNEVKRRDTKGLYKKAEDGHINNMIGIDVEYEEPLNPNLIIDTENLELSNAIIHLYSFLVK
ncbi:adenylyl-sulfate kinase [Arcobacter sp.]|uniref:adenylyl-sulfate kinase n=1 Tax=Arcobacter sp. TaxID=1872629 RepID=UPI003D0F4D6D